MKPARTTAEWSDAIRLGGLRRFAVAITVLNILGHTWFGFEQAWAVPFVALAAAYSTELLLEILDARLSCRPVRFTGGPRRFVDFFLSAHITGLAVGMLIYTNSRLWPVAFAASAAIASKTIFRVRAGKGSRHFYNPSNFGITLTLLLFPWIGIAQPYQFTENLVGAGDWILPGIIVLSGTFLNARFTRRLPLIGTWLSCFALQAALRHWLLGARFVSALMPMTGVAFILYTFYMVTDPATTPSSKRGQLAFGAAVAFTYGTLMVCHVVFGLFFALSIVCTMRGAVLWAQSRVVSGRREVAAVPEDAVAAAVRT
jgi:enediyne biosynthesis protein E5